MGQQQQHVSILITRRGQEGVYRTFPIKRRRPKGETKDEFTVYLGFPDQKNAEAWLDWGLRDGFLAKVKGLKSGVPDKPV